VSTSNGVKTMQRTRAMYSMVQYVPDGARAEGANAGIVIFVPESGRIEVRTSQSLARIKKFFSPDKAEFEWIELAVKSLKHRLEKAQGEFKSEEEFTQFVASRADAVRLTTPRLVVLTELESKLDELYGELVGDEAARVRAAKGVSLPSSVAETFGRLQAAGKVWRPGRIAVPETNRKIEIPLAYRNGRVNYVLPQSLARSVRPEDRLPKLGFHGLLIHQHKIDDEASHLIVLSADAKADLEAEKHYAEVLDDFHVDFVPFNQAEVFAAEVEKTAH
jgi:hypothetical protein